MTTKRIPEPVEGSALQSSVLRLRSATLQQPRIPKPEKDPWNGSVASSRRVEGSAWQSSVTSTALSNPAAAQDP